MYTHFFSKLGQLSYPHCTFTVSHLLDWGECMVFMLCFEAHKPIKKLPNVKLKKSLEHDMYRPQPLCLHQCTSHVEKCCTLWESILTRSHHPEWVKDKTMTPYTAMLYWYLKLDRCLSSQELNCTSVICRYIYDYCNWITKQNCNAYYHVRIIFSY